MNKKIIGAFTVILFLIASYSYGAGDTLKIYCYAAPAPTSQTVELWSTSEFDENTITWNNMPPKIKLLTTTTLTTYTGWYEFTSDTLTQYLDSCILVSAPICFRIKLQNQVGNSSIWNFYCKEQDLQYAPQLIRSSSIYTPPHDDARVDEYNPDMTHCCDFLWVCNFTSPQRQESFVLFRDTSTAGTEENKKSKTELLRVYPNPSGNNINISYTISTGDRNKEYSLKTYDINGKLIRTLKIQTSETGKYHIKWDAKDENGKKVATGIYLLVFTAGEKRTVAKVLCIQ